MGSLRLVYCVTLTFIFKVKHFKLCICYKQFAQAADIPGELASTGMAPAVELLFL